MPYLSRFSVVLGLLFLLFFTGCGEQQEEFALTLSVTPADAGTVTCVPAQATYAEGTAVTLSAQAASGWRFVRWEGAVEGTETATTTITMTQAETVVAYFVEEEPADTTPPEIVLSGDAEITLECGESFTDPGAMASDNVDGDISARIVVRGDTVDPTKPGVYSLYYEITDAAGNTTTQTRTVTVRDTQAPSLTLLGEAEITLECGDSFAEPGATASDNVDGDLSDAIISPGRVNPQVAGIYRLPYTVTDAAGNTTTKIRTVIMEDTQAPTLTLLGEKFMVHECNTPFEDPGAFASDICEGVITDSVEVTGYVNIYMYGTYTLRYTVTDEAGFDAVPCTRTVMVGKRIDSIEELQKIGNDEAYPLKGHYLLSRDIDASSTKNWNQGLGFKPIGKEERESSNMFGGRFYGQRHVITGLYINRQGEGAVGLFCALGLNGKIVDLALEDVSVSGGRYTGGLIGYKRGGSLENCHSAGEVSGYDYVGGLVGYHFESSGGLSDSIYRCSSDTFVSGGSYVGGLVGLNEGVVSNCYSTGTVEGCTWVGGFVGCQIYYGKISQSYSANVVRGWGRPIGYESFYSTGWVENCFWDAEIIGQEESFEIGTELTTSEMMQAATFMDAGWDFEAIWGIDEGQSYPFLLEVPEVNED